MICGKAMAIKGAICDPCQERIHREAMGQQADLRGQAEKELKKHGVNPDSEREKNREKSGIMSAQVTIKEKEAGRS